MNSTNKGGGKGRIVAAVLSPIALLISFAMLDAPGPPNYTLTQDSLTIHDRFYPFTLAAANVDTSNVRVVDFARETNWQPVARTNGFGSVHYHSGSFRVASGKVVRMYRADSTRLVLLPVKGDGSNILLEAKDPEQFLAEMKKSGRWRRDSPEFQR